MFTATTPVVNFVDLEKKILSFWEKEGIVAKYLRKNSNSPEFFSFLDGPITVNNPMGVHHAWGRTYKDLWQRYFTMKGKKQRFQNGFDCQGLWVEVEVEKELGFKTKKDIEKYGVAEFVEKCKERVIKYAKIQTDQSKRLGYFMDWQNSYFTMSEANNYMIWFFLKTCFNNGWIYKGAESVPWCPRCETAISQHEMLTEDYKEVTHESIFFKLPVIGKDKEFLLVWTTTPWTLPANIAVAVEEKFDYSLVKIQSGEKLWLAGNLVDKVIKETDKKILKTVKGSNLVGLKYLTPFVLLEAVAKVVSKNPDKIHLVIATDENIMPITTVEGTGLVHTAVSAGTEDFKLGKKLGLPMIPVIADNAEYLEGLGSFTGMNAKTYPRIIFDYLEKQNTPAGFSWIYRIEKYKHRYPACWRCKTELVWKVTDEWYIAMDVPDKKDGKTFREKMQKAAKEITWHPSFGLERELDWLKNMNDWLISKKNRYWGLALPIYECAKCHSFEVIGSKEELKQRAVNGWDKFAGHSPHKPWIDHVKIKCQKCSTTISRIKDVGNPWLDAGIVPFSTIAKNNQEDPLYQKERKEWLKWFPADFITESFPGQFKNWFYALIAMSAALENKAPFKTVLGFATMLAEDGRPMHKSWGNMIEFNQGAEKIGVDVMRWMYVRQNPSNNMLFGYKIADEVRRKFHLILWNTYNYFITYANLYQFKPGELQSKSVLDKWILSKFNKLLLEVTADLEGYNACQASLKIEDFVTHLSTWYIRRSRNRVSQDANPKDIQSFLNTLYFILRNLMKILAPFLPFITEEIYKSLTDEQSVHLTDWPVYDKKMIDLELEEDMLQLRLFVENFHALRKEKNIKLRIPVYKASYIHNKRFFRDLEQVIKEELNLKEIGFKKQTNKNQALWEVDFSDKNLSLSEGKARDIIRRIQQKRKELHFALQDRIDVTLPDWPSQFENYIKEKTLARNLIKGQTLMITRI